MKKDFQITTSKNNLLNVTAFGIENINAPCIIFVHGFKGFKNWGFGPFIGEYFASKGFFVLTFNFSHNGIGQNPIEFTEVEKFAQNTFSLEISELQELIENYKNGFFGKVENPKIGMIGHSRGGAITLLTSYNNENVKSAAVWASVSKLDRYSKRQKEEWRKKGSFEVVNQRTKQVMKLNVSLLEDIEKNSSGNLNIENAVKNFNKPLLIIHGEQDLAVPVKEADELFEWADKEKTEILKIPNTGHTFDIKHPFEGSNEKFDEVLEKTLEFFKQNLK